MELRIRRRRVRLVGILVGAFLAWPAVDAFAQPHGTSPGALTPEQIAFDAADTDGDNVVSEAELARDAARGFATLDQNGDGKLSTAELEPHDSALFRRVDTSGDGFLTFEEVMANKMRALKAGDKNQDGGLSFEEMVTIVQSEVGGGA